MRIIAQSTLASGSPYIHLGYGSATAREAQQTLLNGGIMGLILGLAMIGAAIINWAVSRAVGVGLSRRRSIILLLAGLTFIVLGCISLKLSYVYAREYYGNPELATESRADSILATIRERRDRNQDVPADLPGLGVEQRELTDGWWNPLRLVTDGTGEKTYSIVSAGPDGKFGTADDLRFTLEPPWKEREGIATAHLKHLAKLAAKYAAASNNSLPSRVGDLLRSDEYLYPFLNDPRVKESPFFPGRETDLNTRIAQAESHCDFYYAGAGVRLSDVSYPSSFIVLYDHPDAGPNRLVAFADGHVEKRPASSPQLERFVADTNGQRTELKLPALPIGLSGPPPAGP